MNTQDGKGKRTFTEEIEVLGDQLVQQVKDLLNEGNVRQLRIRASDGDIVLETPLTFGVVAGGAVALAAPWLAILGVLAAFVTHAQVEVVREVDDADAQAADKADEAAAGVTDKPTGKSGGA
ncbi:MAG: DUF4342 domain-containing protein [Hoeflea sp.]|nr:DUF4342 domain-containing protein [Hoeflea sp.]